MSHTATAADRRARLSRSVRILATDKTGSSQAASKSIAVGRRRMTMAKRERWYVMAGEALLVSGAVAGAVAFLLLAFFAVIGFTVCWDWLSKW